VPAQGGFFLIEAMVAILIFALGILGLVAMGGTAVSSQSDAQYRTEASTLADAIASEIALGIDRTNEATRRRRWPASSRESGADHAAGAVRIHRYGDRRRGKPGSGARSTAPPIWQRLRVSRERPTPTSRSSSTPPATSTASSSRCAGKPRATTPGAGTRW
jgi:hypothetical protein